MRVGDVRARASRDGEDARGDGEDAVDGRYGIDGSGANVGGAGDGGGDGGDDPEEVKGDAGEPARRRVRERLVMWEPAGDAREIAEVRGGVTDLDDERARAGKEELE